MTLDLVFIKLESEDKAKFDTFKTYLGKEAVYSFNNNMIEEVNIVANGWKNILAKNLCWLKKAMKILRTLLNVTFVTMIMLVIVNISIENSSENKDCNNKLKLFHKLLVVS